MTEQPDRPQPVLRHIAPVVCLIVIGLIVLGWLGQLYPDAVMWIAGGLTIAVTIGIEISALRRRRQDASD